MGHSSAILGSLLRSSNARDTTLADRQPANFCNVLHTIPCAGAKYCTVLFSVQLYFFTYLSRVLDSTALCACCSFWCIAPISGGERNRSHKGLSLHHGAESLRTARIRRRLVSGRFARAFGQTGAGQCCRGRRALAYLRIRTAHPTHIFLLAAILCRFTHTFIGVYYIRQFDIYLLKPYYFLHRLHTTVQYTIIHVRQRWERVWASRSSTNLLRVVKSQVWAKILPSLPQTSFLGLVFSLGLLSLVCCIFCFKNLDYWLWDFDCLALIYIL